LANPQHHPLTESTPEESPRYPWRSYSVLRTHDFVELAPGAGEQARLFLCRACARAFKFDASLRRTWAVTRDGRHAPLPRAVSERWVAERCTGRQRAGDDEVVRRVRPARS
jgi:hypothetical protein